jgi:hypothetical protein
MKNLPYTAEGFEVSTDFKTSTAVIRTRDIGNADDIVRQLNNGSLLLQDFVVESITVRETCHKVIRRIKMAE